MLYAAAVEDMFADVFVDNFGIGGGQGTVSERPYSRIGLDNVQSNRICRLDWHDFDEEASAVVLWFPNSQQYGSFIGVDMMPKKHFEFFPGFPPIFQLNIWERGKNGPPDQAETIKIGECSVYEDDGGGWVLQRLGPFYSNGGYDWLTIEMRDVWRLSNVLREHPDGVYFTSALLAAASDSSKILGLPPIHLHHVHVGPQVGAMFKIRDETIYFTDVMLEVHGDYVCLPEDGGVNCLFQKPSMDNVREIDRAVDMMGQLNEVRAPASESMKWWFLMAIHWHPKTTGNFLPESQSQFGPATANLRNYENKKLSSNANVPVWSNMPSDKDPYGNLGKGPQLPANETLGFVPIRNQNDYFGTFGLNTSEHVIAWCSSTMFHGGDMIRVKIHSHNAMFERYLQFRASPHELGLVGGTHHFPFHNAYEFTLLRDTAFQNFDDVQFYLMSNLAKAQGIYHKNCESSSSSRVECDINRPFLICKAFPKDAEVYDEKLEDFFVYDRRQSTCCNRWTFKIGEVATIIGFYHPIIRPLGPWAPLIPKEFPMHLGGWMEFKMQGPTINMQPSFRMGHSHYFLHVFTRPGSSFNTLLSGDIWDYLLRLPPTLDPNLRMVGTFNFYCVRLMSTHRWHDGLHDGPHDDASLVLHGVYSKLINGDGYMPSPMAISMGIFKQNDLIWQLGVVLAGLVLMFMKCV